MYYNFTSLLWLIKEGVGHFFASNFAFSRMFIICIFFRNADGTSTEVSCVEVNYACFEQQEMCLSFHFVEICILKFQMDSMNSTDTLLGKIMDCQILIEVKGQDFKYSHNTNNC